jgi:hypothetical protein
MIKRTAAHANIIPGDNQTLTAYSYRKGAATRWIDSVGYKKARQLMQHKANSKVLEKVYDGSMEEYDVVAASLQEEGNECLVQPNQTWQLS